MPRHSDPTGHPHLTGPAGRDRALRHFRAIAGGAVVIAVGGAGGLSVVAARAFQGHASTDPVRAPAARPRHRARSVPPAQAVPQIAGQVEALAPPPQPPEANPVPVDPQPEVSGGS